MMTMGKDLIAELGRRGELGMYFDYLGYRKLRKLNSSREIVRFLEARGFRCSKEVANTQDLVNALQKNQSDITGNNALLAISLSDPTGILGIVLMPFLLMKTIFGPHRETRPSND